MTGTTPAPCDVVGCDERATGVYVDMRARDQFEFQVCGQHFDQLQRGERPVVVAERLDRAEPAGRPALILS